MLNHEESLVLDERYRQMVEEDVPTNGLSNFHEAISILTSRKANIDSQHRVIILMRKYSSPPSSKFPYSYRGDLIEGVINLSHKQQYPQLRYQALRILVNMASDKANHSRLIEKGAVNFFSSLIHHENASISRLAIWGIGNIAVGFEREMIGQEVVKQLIEFQKTSRDEKTNEILLWTLANLLQFFRKTIDTEAFNALMPAYSHSIPLYVREIWVYTITLCFKKDMISALFESGTVSQLFDFIKSKNVRLVDKSLGLMSLIITGGYQYIDKLIDLNLIGQIQILLENQSPNQKHISYLLTCLSRYAHNSCKQILAESDIILRKMLAIPNKQPKSFLFKVELCNFFFNISSFANPFKLYSLYKQFNYMRVFFDKSETKINATMIYALPDVLELGKKFKENGKNVFLEALRSEGAVERWQYLLQSEDELLVSQLLIIFDRYIHP